MINQTILQTARAEERARSAEWDRQAKITEDRLIRELFDILPGFKALGEIMTADVPGARRQHDSQSSCDDAIAITRSDIGMAIQLNAAIKSLPDQGVATWPLRFNKLIELFNGALSLLQDNCTYAVRGHLFDLYPIDPSVSTVFGGMRNASGVVVNYFGTSWPNFVQIAYWAVFRATFYSPTDFRDISIEDFQKTFRNHQDAAYQVDGSPNIQTTKLPNGFDSSPYRNWFYYNKGKQTPEQGELLVPTLGYAYGGSREDERYAQKVFKNEDCSSSVAKWAGASVAFSTKHMLTVAKNETCPAADIKYCESVQSSLKPVACPAGDDLVGLVFVWPSHTGVVSGLFGSEDSANSIMETLSYNRDMPNMEGFGYQNYTLVSVDGCPNHILTDAGGQKPIFFLAGLEESAQQDVVGKLVSGADYGEL